MAAQCKPVPPKKPLQLMSAPLLQQKPRDLNMAVASGNVINAIRDQRCVVRGRSASCRNHHPAYAACTPGQLPGFNLPGNSQKDCTTSNIPSPAAAHMFSCDLAPWRTRMSATSRLHHIGRPLQWGHAPGCLRVDVTSGSQQHLNANSAIVLLRRPMQRRLVIGSSGIDQCSVRFQQSLHISEPRRVPLQRGLLLQRSCRHFRSRSCRRRKNPSMLDSSKPETPTADPRKPLIRACFLT